MTDDAYDSANGLAPVQTGILACPECGALFARSAEGPTMFHDYTTYYFTRIDKPPLSGEALEMARFERRQIERRLSEARSSPYDD